MPQLPLVKITKHLHKAKLSENAVCFAAQVQQTAMNAMVYLLYMNAGILWNSQKGQGVSQCSILYLCISILYRLNIDMLSIYIEIKNNKAHSTKML